VGNCTHSYDHVYVISRFHQVSAAFQFAEHFREFSATVRTLGILFELNASSGTIRDRPPVGYGTPGVVSDTSDLCNCG
jgi:hypothetical protein